MMIRRSLDSENASIAVMMYKRAGEEEPTAGSVAPPANSGTETKKESAPAEKTSEAPAAAPSFANGKSQTYGFPGEETKTSEKPTSTEAAKPKSSSSPETTEKHGATIPTLSHPGATASNTSATTNTAIAASNNDNSETLSGSAIGAIVAIVCIIFLGVIAFFFMKRRQKKKVAMNSRLTRFSMGPTYNATTAPGVDAAHGYSTAMSNNTNNNYSDPFAYSNNNANAYSTATTPMTYNNAAPAMDYNNAPGYNTSTPQMGYNNASPMDYNASPVYNQPPQQQQPFMPQPPSPVTTGSAPPMPEPMSAPVVAAGGVVAGAGAVAAVQPAQEQAPDQQQAIGTFTVVAGYMPALSDEVQVRPGDQVQVFVEYDDGWCLGANLTTGQQRGVFPKHCISPPTSVPAPMATDPLAQQQQQQQQQQQLPVVPAGLSVVDPKHQSKRVSSLYSNPQ